MESASTNSPESIPGVPVRERFDQIFENEIESWCCGLSSYKGSISRELIHRVVREIMPVFKNAVQCNYVFDLIGTSGRLAAATKNSVCVKEVALSVLYQMPAPYEMDEESQYVFASLIDQADREYGGVLALLEKKWRKDRTVRY